MKTPSPPDLAGPLDRAFEDALAGGHFSGAAMIVAVGREVLLSRTWGFERWGGEPVTSRTFFDLASLTKPLVTVPLVMYCTARGIFGPDDVLSRFFANVPPPKRMITVRHLLSHSSGLAPYRQFFYDLVKLPPEKRRDAMVSMILEDPLDFEPGKAASYSDLGYILLGAILEDILGDRLDRLAEHFLYGPRGINSLHFNPLDTREGPEATPRAGFREGARYAAAEQCPWRKRLLVGEVSDENAWSLGGIAGHAGLFGTAGGVCEMVSALWNAYQGKMDHEPFSPGLVRFFWTRAGIPEESGWTLGFDTPRPVESSAGKYFSRNSVGHLGFTGTSFWLDLDRRVLVVLLANRVHPSRENEAFKKFRPIVHDIVMEALGYGS